MNYATLATADSVQKTVDVLKQKGYEALVVSSESEALAEIKQRIPEGASVMNGSSVTLQQIGFVDYLKSNKHKWNNLHAGIVAEKDLAKQGLMRKQALLSDFYLGSVHALTQTGEFLIASNTGSQLPHIVYSSVNLIFVVSTKKIVSDLIEAMQRLEKHVIPLENDHMMKLYNVGTAPNKVVLFRGESRMMGRKITVILVEKDLGF